MLTGQGWGRGGGEDALSRGCTLGLSVATRLSVPPTRILCSHTHLKLCGQLHGHLQGDRQQDSPEGFRTDFHTAWWLLC